MRLTNYIRASLLIILLLAVTLPMLALTAVVLLHDNSTINGAILSATADELLIDPDGPVSMRRITAADASYFEVVELAKIFTFPINTDVLNQKAIRPKTSTLAGSTLWKVPTLYIAPSIGLGGGLQGSSDIDELFETGMSPESLEANLGLRVGYRNLVQLELRASARTATVSDVDMSMGSSQVLFKINPLGFGEDGKDDDNGLFFLVGFGSSDAMLDAYEDGFRDGSLSTFGLEYFWIDKSKCVLGVSGSLEYEMLKYKVFDLGDYGSYYLDTSIGYFRCMVNFYAGFDLGLH